MSNQTLTDTVSVSQSLDSPQKPSITPKFHTCPLCLEHKLHPDTLKCGGCKNSLKRLLSVAINITKGKHDPAWIADYVLNSLFPKKTYQKLAKSQQESVEYALYIYLTAKELDVTPQEMAEATIKKYEKEAIAKNITSWLDLFPPLPEYCENCGDELPVGEIGECDNCQAMPGECECGNTLDIFGYCDDCDYPEDDDDEITPKFHTCPLCYEGKVHPDTLKCSTCKKSLKRVISTINTIIKNSDLHTNIWDEIDKRKTIRNLPIHLQWTICRMIDVVICHRTLPTGRWETLQKTWQAFNPSLNPQFCLNDPNQMEFDFFWLPFLPTCECPNCQQETNALDPKAKGGYGSPCCQCGQPYPCICDLDLLFGELFGEADPDQKEAEAGKCQNCETIVTDDDDLCPSCQEKKARELLSVHMSQYCDCNYCNGEQIHPKCHCGGWLRCFSDGNHICDNCDDDIFDDGSTTLEYYPSIMCPGCGYYTEKWIKSDFLGVTYEEWGDCACDEKETKKPKIFEAKEEISRIITQSDAKGLYNIFYAELRHANAFYKYQNLVNHGIPFTISSFMDGGFIEFVPINLKKDTLTLTLMAELMPEIDEIFIKPRLQELIWNDPSRTPQDYALEIIKYTCYCRRCRQMADIWGFCEKCDYPNTWWCSKCNSRQKRDGSRNCKCPKAMVPEANPEPEPEPEPDQSQGDNEYCWDCGTKLNIDQFGRVYCPKCDPYHNSELALLEAIKLGEIRLYSSNFAGWQDGCDCPKCQRQKAVFEWLAKSNLLGGSQEDKTTVSSLLAGMEAI